VGGEVPLPQKVPKTCSIWLYPGQLSLAIPPWVGTMNTGESWNVNRQMRANEMEISAALWALWLGEGLYFTLRFIWPTQQVTGKLKSVVSVFIPIHF